MRGLCLAGFAAVFAFGLATPAMADGDCRSHVTATAQQQTPNQSLADGSAVSTPIPIPDPGG